MAITKSAKKAARRSIKLQARNREFKIRMKMHMKKIFKAIEKGEDVLPEMLSNVYKFIDKAAKVGVIKKKNAGRKKSRVALAVNKAQSEKK